MRNLPEIFKRNLVEVKRISYRRAEYGGGSDIFSVKTFPLTLYEIYGTVNGGVTEGKAQFSYYVGTGNAFKIKYDTATRLVATTWWTASPNASNTYSVHYVAAAGSSTSNHATNANGVSLAHAIGKIRNQ